MRELIRSQDTLVELNIFPDGGTVPDTQGFIIGLMVAGQADGMELVTVDGMFREGMRGSGFLIGSGKGSHKWAEAGERTGHDAVI